jgi:hypothetical protein
MSSSGVFGPTPPGVNLSETQNAAVVNAVVSLMIIGTIFVVLRVIARTMQKGMSLALDDYLVMLGLVCSYHISGNAFSGYSLRSPALCTWNSHLLHCQYVYISQRNWSC